MSENLEQPKQIEAPQPKRLSGLVVWLFLVPFVFGTLIGFSELAMIIDLDDFASDTRSLLEAGYQPWDYNRIPPINVAAFFEDIQRELAMLGTPVVLATVQEGAFWIPATPIDEITFIETPNPEILATIEPTLTETAERPTLSISTSTVVVTLTPTVTNTYAPLYTFTPPPPDTPNPPTATFTPTIVLWTPTHTNQPPEPTQTFTATIKPLTPTFTATIKPLTPTPDFTPTVAPVAVYHVIPIAENLGESTPNLDGEGCMAIFGYRNEDLVEVDIPVGDQNRLSQPYLSIEPDGELPTHFRVDRVSPAFGVIWNVPEPITWILDDSEAVVQWCNP